MEDKFILNQIDKAKTNNRLVLYNLNITDEIWQEITKLTKLERLIFESSEIGSVPENINSLINLKDLAIQGCSLKEFPIYFTQIQTLESIDLGYNDLSDLPKEFANFQQLTYLNLSGNHFSKIPEVLVDLPKLTKLRLDANKITEITEKIIDNKILSYIELRRNPLEAINFTFKIKIENDNQIDTHSLFEEILNDNLPLKRKNDLFFTFKTESNYGFIQVYYHHTTSIAHLEKNSIDIYIIGDINKRIKLLSQIRNCINKWAESTNFEIMSREFFYPLDFIKNIFDSSPSHYHYTFINYDKLLNYKSSGEEMYFDDLSQTKISVSELLEFIGNDEIEIENNWKGTDTITHLHIKNFKSFKEIQVPVSDRINIVLGRNGLGKTSLLQAITLGLLPPNNADKSNEFENYIRLGSPQSEIIILWGEEYRKVYVFRNKFEEQNRVNFPQKLLLAYGVNLNTYEKLDHSEITEHLQTGYALPYSTKSIFKDYSTDFYDPIVLLEKLYIESFKKNTEIVEILTLIKNTINNYLSLIEDNERITLEQDNTDFYYLDYNGNKLKTKHLSEGYKDHILLITDIIVRIIAARKNIFTTAPSIEKLFAECNGVVLIDEFDRHLHPVWQRKLLLQLKKDFPKIQFFLTTHNLFSLQSAEGFNALIMSINEKNEISVTNKPIKKGLSLESIFNMYFDGKNNFFGAETELLFEQFYQLITKIKKQEATENEVAQFKIVASELLELEEEVQVTVSRELKQMERQTGKKFEL